MVDHACFDIRVSTLADVVWRKGDPLNTEGGRSQLDRAVAGLPDLESVCSDQYGNADGGDITYVGPCDASPEVDTQPGTDGTQNDVTIWVDGLYDALGDDLGDWQDPCGVGGCTLSVSCTENEDQLAEFNLTVLRQAKQGFFDIVVNFDDIFCSAKLDTCYDGEPIKLLHGSDGERDWTAVFGFACTAGSDDSATNLMYGSIQVDCGAAGWFVLDPSLEPGTRIATDGVNTLRYGIYRGLEELDCGSGVGSCNKAYWNLAIDIDELRALNATCTLSLTATANDGNNGFSNGLPTSPGLAYPYIDAFATLTTAAESPATEGVGTCQQEPLGGPNGVVATTYKGTIEGLSAPATAMCHEFDGTVMPTGAVIGCLADCPAEAQPEDCVDLRAPRTWYCYYNCRDPQGTLLHGVRCTCKEVNGAVHQYDCASCSR